LPGLLSRNDESLDHHVMSTVETVHDRYADEDVLRGVETWARELWKGRVNGDFGRRQAEKPAERLRRTKAVAFLCEVGRDSSLLTEAGRRGRLVLAAMEAGESSDSIVDPALIDTIVGVAIEEGGSAVQERAIAVLTRESDPQLRAALL